MALTDAQINKAFADQFPPDQTPTYIVDFGEGFHFENKPYTPSIRFPWKIVEVQRLSTKDKGVFLNEGYGAISYAYGASSRKGGLVRENYDSKIVNIPVPDTDAIKKVLPVIPQILYGEGETRKDQLIFTIDEIKAVFWAMKKRFIWWDLACVPQEDRSTQDNVTRDKGVWGPDVATGTVREKANFLEVDKQKFVYGQAKVGTIWLLEADFSDPKADHPVKRMLSKRPLFDIQDFVGGLPKADKAIQWLMAILGAPALSTKYAFREALLNFSAGKGNDGITLDSITASDRSFSSLWCFQESKLMQNQIFLDRNAKCLNWPDQENLSLLNTFAEVKIMGVDKPVTRPGMRALSSMVTFLAAEISLALSDPQDERLPEAVRGLPYNLDHFVNWTADMEVALKRISRCGLIYLPKDSPLDLIVSARRNRICSVRYPANKYNAMIGVLDLTGMNKTAGAKDGLAWSQNFFEAVLNKHQWHTLLLAKLNRRTPDNYRDLELLVSEMYDGWASVSEGLLEPIRAYFKVFNVDHGISNMTSLPTLTYNNANKEDEVLMKYSGSKLITLEKLTGAKKIQAYQLELDPYGFGRGPAVQPPAVQPVAAQTSAAQPTKWEPDPYLPMRINFQSITFSPTRPNYVSVVTVQPNVFTEQVNASGRVLGRVGTVFFRLHDLPDTELDKSVGKVAAARFAVIRLTPASYKTVPKVNSAAGQTPDSLTGVFEGIIDIYGGEFTTISTPVVKMWWQERTDGTNEAWPAVLDNPAGANAKTDSKDPAVIAATAKDAAEDEKNWTFLNMASLWRWLV